MTHRQEGWALVVVCSALSAVNFYGASREPTGPGTVVLAVLGLLMAYGAARVLYALVFD